MVFFTGFSKLFRAAFVGPFDLACCAARYYIQSAVVSGEAMRTFE
jgi:hypothetical protein